MHEASIVQSILEIAEKEARKHGSSRIRKIRVKIGEFRGVVREALEFSFDVLRAGTLAEEAELEVETVPLRVSCEKCGEGIISLTDLNFFCSTCGDPVRIVGGREMEVESLELE